ncbi:MAG: hypothetical protein JRN59_06650 [Nitrososphaerota archaeon]|nr:hypothetical protein [Nitrososphaerota archaeon]
MRTAPGMTRRRRSRAAHQTEGAQGKYRHHIKSDWEALEEMSEDPVWKR